MSRDPYQEEAYAIQAVELLWIKIGRCRPRTAPERYRAATRAIGEPCAWLGYLDVPEREAHIALAPHRVWNEWFIPDEEVISYILEHQTEIPIQRMNLLLGPARDVLRYAPFRPDLPETTQWET